MSRRKSRRGRTESRARYLAIGGLLAVAIVGYLLATTALGRQSGTPSGTSSVESSGTQSAVVTSSGPKPIILYVNQGNGVVNGSNFDALLETATSHGFNTIFFQIYRSGVLLFQRDSLVQFVTMSHDRGLRIFFALYLTSSTQTIPTSIYADGEDGISLDMSTLSVSVQAALLHSLSSGFSGTTAITTTDFELPLKPDMLVLETYGTGNEQYIHHGVVASVGVFATSSLHDYQQQLQYALANSDGVMVFDYAGLVKAGY